ncbi:hypothetical protein [Geomicrobium sp. JCM 19055]|uniref:hypothetical protein n=1 Tax=Geomicrobium sp. JCM 19055 TaxID=1460649 RepID=UPI0005A68ECB|nr:hypothetical protein [Geomicrobium sp. JCM 19055]
MNPDTLGKRIEALQTITNRYQEIPLITVTLNNEASKNSFLHHGLVLSDDPTDAVYMLKALNFYRKYFNKKIK